MTTLKSFCKNILNVICAFGRALYWIAMTAIPGAANKLWNFATPISAAVLAGIVVKILMRQADKTYAADAAGRAAAPGTETVLAFVGHFFDGWFGTILAIVAGVAIALIFVSQLSPLPAGATAAQKKSYKLRNWGTTLLAIFSILVMTGDIGHFLQTIVLIVTFLATEVWPYVVLGIKWIWFLLQYAGYLIYWAGDWIIQFLA